MTTNYKSMNQQEREIFMREIAGMIDSQLDEEICFTLIVWPEHHQALSNYISNGNRVDVIKALRETADRLERNMDMPPVMGSA